MITLVGAQLVQEDALVLQALEQLVPGALRAETAAARPWRAVTGVLLEPVDEGRQLESPAARSVA